MKTPATKKPSPTKSTGTRGRISTEGPSKPTYQAHLDHALEETFPASDPIAISAPEPAAQKRRTTRDPIDWDLHGGPQPPAAKD